MIFHPIEDLSSSVQAALLRDLPPIVTREKDMTAWNRLPLAEKKARSSRAKKGDQTAFPMVNRQKRPFMRDILIWVFPQVWPSTSLGFTGTGGVINTPAYTVIVVHQGAHAVYFGGRFAYLVMEDHAGASRTDPGWKAFKADVANESLVGCLNAVDKYQAIRYRGDASD